MEMYKYASHCLFYAKNPEFTCQGISASSATFCLDFGVGKVLPNYGNASKREERAYTFSGGYIIAPEHNEKNWKRK